VTKTGKVPHQRNKDGTKITLMENQVDDMEKKQIKKKIKHERKIHRHVKQIVPRNQTKYKKDIWKQTTTCQDKKNEHQGTRNETERKRKKEKTKRRKICSDYRILILTPSLTHPSSKDTSQGSQTLTLIRPETKSLNNVKPLNSIGTKTKNLTYFFDFAQKFYFDIKKSKLEYNFWKIIFVSNSLCRTFNDQDYVLVQFYYFHKFAEDNSLDAVYLDPFLLCSHRLALKRHIWKYK
jgi:hypothetical protein